MGIFDFSKKRNLKGKEGNIKFDVSFSVERTEDKYIDPWDKYKGDQKIDNSHYKKNYEYYNNYQCPNCQHRFEKELSRKIKCPNCKNHIIVRTHFSSRRKLLLTEKEAEQFEKERQNYFDLKWPVQRASEFGVEDKDIDDMFKTTRRNIKFDILWSLANKATVEHARNYKWGLYRNTRLDMAEILDHEGKKEKALGFYLLACFLDLNGPSNVLLINGKPSADIPMYDTERGFIAPAVIGEIEKLSDELNVTEETLKEKFISYAESEKNQLMPLSPENAWEKFLKKYREND